MIWGEMNWIRILLISLFFPWLCLHGYAQEKEFDVLIIGGGASGTMAGIQSARLGVSTVIVEEGPWLGGMLTAAGVSAIDGNYRLHSGLWEEFRQSLNQYYGGEDSLKTGWVSNVLFEPQVGAKLLEEMAAQEKNLEVMKSTKCLVVNKSGERWNAQLSKNGEQMIVKAKLIIDATELGDIAAMLGASYDIGMDSRKETGEAIAPERANDIIQDLTYVAILKDYGKGADRTIPRPKNYDPSTFLNTCARDGEEGNAEQRLWPCDQMMKYGKLPNGYYMINWPINGNDYYVNIIEMNDEERSEALEKAKEYTLNYVYYLQHELGYKHLGLAEGVYPTKDHLPLIPYHRESRRIQGLVRFTVNDLAQPFDQPYDLYKTGIAVGDYPIDHHHAAYTTEHGLPDLHFFPVPSYSLPLGTLIPEEIDNFIVAEKSISVTNIVNGTTRLQPVCMLIGQASGALAALSVKNGVPPKEVDIRLLQSSLLDGGAYIMPYSDVENKSSAFKAIQKIGATGILRGEGKNIGWENHTHIYPDSLLSAEALKIGLEDWLDTDKLDFQDEIISKDEAVRVIVSLWDKYVPAREKSGKDWEGMFEMVSEKIRDYNKGGDHLSRAVFALVLDEFVDPFNRRPINVYGEFIDPIH